MQLLKPVRHFIENAKHTVTISSRRDISIEMGSRLVVARLGAGENGGDCYWVFLGGDGNILKLDVGITLNY